MLGLPIRGPGSDTVNALELDQQGRIWIGTRAGVCLWEGGQFVDASALAALEGAPGASFLSDRDGSVWIATATRGLFEFTEGRLHEEFGPNESRRILSCCLLHDHRGRLWALIGNGIVLCRRNGQWAEFNLSNGLALAYISSLAEGPDGSIWAGWLDDGLFQLRGGRFIPFRHEDGLSGGAIREITSGGAPMSRQIARRVVQFFQEINEAPKEVQRAPEIRTLTNSRKPGPGRSGQGSFLQGNRRPLEHQPRDRPHPPPERLRKAAHPQSHRSGAEVSGAVGPLTAKPHGQRRSETDPASLERAPALQHSVPTVSAPVDTRAGSRRDRSGHGRTSADCFHGNAPGLIAIPVPEIQ